MPRNASAEQRFALEAVTLKELPKQFANGMQKE
jgi:hypothetical protein